MATLNPFDLLDDDAEDPSLLIAAQQQKIESKKTAAPSAKPAAAAKELSSQNKAAAQPRLPSKPVPPAQAGELSLYLSLALSGTIALVRYKCHFYIFNQIGRYW